MHTSSERLCAHTRNPTTGN